VDGGGRENGYCFDSSSSAGAYELRGLHGAPANLPLWSHTRCASVMSAVYLLRSTLLPVNFAGREQLRYFETVLCSLSVVLESV
jgi:hypothetical protein